MNYNTSTNYPIIQNAQEYMYEEKFISISSQDINLTKYNANDFEIELPQDYYNVQSIKLASITFPNSLDNFTVLLNNVKMSFIINLPYYPDTTLPNYTYLFAIYTALYTKYISSNPFYVVQISNGIYSNSQLAVELTNIFNESVSSYIIDYFTSIGDTVNLNTFISLGEYTEFVINNNIINQKMYFGNQSSGFILTNNSLLNISVDNNICSANGVHQPIITGNLGLLPYYLGFGYKNVPIQSTPYTSIKPLRFNYLPGISGDWLLPSYPNNPVYCVISPFKMSVYGSKYYIYMEISGFNSIDETLPMQPLAENITGNNGVVNSSFAKIPLYTNPNVPENNIFYNNVIDNPVKIFNPPLTKIRRLRIKFRYHIGDLVQLDGLTYSFTLKLNIFLPQNAKKYTMYTPESR